jgi:uncharacterized membrane protein YdjX (TVP38/TMEM64 family)
LLAVLAIAAVALVYQDRLPTVETLGYPAIFMVSVLGTATLFFPVPAILAVCAGGTLLSPLLSGVIGGTGQALGEGTGYLAGVAGSGLLKENRWHGRLRPWVERRGWMVVLVVAAIPNPVFDVVGMIAGAMRMPLWQFFGAVWVGKTVRSVGVAYGCALGYDFLRALG